MKGPSNEDKGHHELTKDTKREPYKKKVPPKYIRTQKAQASLYLYLNKNKNK